MTLARRLADALAADTTPDRPYLTGDGPLVDGDTLLAEAAVLIAITDRREPGVILTQRAEAMRKHPGQVAFPGGRVDPDDVDAVAAALREAEEEIALPAEAVTIAGVAERYRTGTGFHITPVIGVVAPDLPLHPSETEVASVFEVPLSFLLNPANHREGRGVWQGSERRFFEINWQDRRIWGATAAICVNLSRRLQWR